VAHALRVFLSCSVLSGLLLVPFLLLCFTMSFSTRGAQGPSSVEEFCAGWEGWLEGACLAQLSSDWEDAACVAVLHAEQNGFLVVAEEGDFPCTRPWHHDGWMDGYSRYYYFGSLVYMDLFDKRFFNSLGSFNSRMEQGSCIVYNNQVGGHCCWLDAGDWWIFCRTFYCLKFPLSKVWRVSLVG
jgi:hypothetical protein